MNKESKMKESPATIQNLGVRLGKEEIFFTIGGEDRFRMSASNLLELLDFKTRREALAMEKEEGPEFNVERFVQILRLLRKGLNFPEMLPIFGMPIEDLRAGFLKAEKKFGGSVVVGQEIAKQLEDGEKDWVKQKPIEDVGGSRDGGEKLISLTGLRAFQRQGSNLKEIAKLWNLDYADFQSFIDKNQKYLKHLT